MTRLFITILALAISFAAGANASTVQIAEELVEEAILDNLEDFNPESRIEIKILKGKSALERAIAEDITLASIEFDTDRKTFEGVMKINDMIPQEVAGKYKEIVKIPAISRKLRRDEIITAKHITYIEIDSSKLSRGYITDEVDLIGKSPVRTLFRNRPVMPKQVSEPKIVERKHAVTMLFENSALQIQTSGTAMEDGSMNELIRVKNINSNVIIHAKVIGDNLVQVMSGQKIMASNF